MLNRIHRFHGKAAVSFMYRDSQVIKSQAFQVRHRPKKTAHARAAVVVSKKVSKSAVVRNRIRRRVYEWLRVNDMVTTNDILISIFQADLATVSSDTLDKRLQNAFPKEVIQRENDIIQPAKETKASKKPSV